MINIRRFVWSDYEAVVAVWAAGGREVVPREELEAKLLRDPELFLVAETGPSTPAAGDDATGADMSAPEAGGDGTGAGPSAQTAGDDGTGADTSLPEAGQDSCLAGGVVGVVMGTYDGRRGWILRLAVRPECRRRGIARRLVEELERRYQEIGCPRVNLLVMPDNAAGLRFWQEVGYLPVPDVLCTKPMPAAR